MAEILRSNAYISCIKEFLNNTKEADEVINESETTTLSTKKINDTSSSDNNQVVERKQFFKNGVISDYVYESLSYASKNTFLKIFTNFAHTKKIKKYFHIVSNAFVEKYYTVTKTDAKSAYENPLALFKEDFRDKVKWMVKMIDSYKLLLKRNKKFKRIVKKLLSIQKKLLKDNLSASQKENLMKKVEKLNAKHEVAFMHKNKNLLQTFQDNVNAFNDWLISSNDYFKIAPKDYGFLNIFIDSNIKSTRGKIIHFDVFPNLVTNCLEGLDLYKKSMEAYGYKISKSNNTATANNSTNTIKIDI